MNGIFVSYRRGETGSHAAGRISQCLNDRYGEDFVFFDVQDIRAGGQFDTQIDDALKHSRALVVVIDKHWISVEQLKRLHDPEDFVRREIAAALGRDVMVIPVLIDDTPMPTADSLPDCLKSLCAWQAMPLRHTTFDGDIGALIAELDKRYAELEALRNAMPCPHCQAAINVSPGERLAACPSCGADVGVVRIVLSGNETTETGRELSRLLKLAAIDVSSEMYHDAYEQYDRILESAPDCWEALTNKAVCLFWIGSEDLCHLPEVFGLLEKAALLSNRHPKVYATRRSLAYNLAALANAEEMIGDGISWSLDLFKFCEKVESDDSEREALVADYVERCFDGIKKRLVGLLMRDGKSFDPPLAEISTLSRLLRMGGSVEALRFFMLMADRKLEVSSSSNGLFNELNLAKDELTRVSPNAAPLRIVFPFIGNPRIEEI